MRSITSRISKKFFYVLLVLSLFTSRANAQTTLAAGDLAFVGYISADDGVNGATQDDEFSFILLKDITSGTIINFTDFGWLSTVGFQTANPCGSNTGAINDGIISWTSTSAMTCGTQVRIKCKYGLTATSGTVTGIQACNNDPSAYLSLAIGGDQIFAYQGAHVTPTLLAGISINKAWDATLVSCFFSSNSSVLPGALASVNNVAITSGINAKYNCSTTNNIPSVLIPAINNTANWNTDNTFAPPVPLAFSLPLSCSFSCVAGPSINVSSVTGTITACLGTASASPNVQQFTVSGSLLSNDIVLTAPANFEISTTIGSGYSGTITLTQSGGNVASTTIFVRSAATAPVGAISGNISAVSSPAPSQSIAVSGTVNPIPTAVATPSSQSTCSGSALTTIVLSGAVGGTTYNWTRDNTGSVTGIAASGSGDISGTLTNTTSAPVTVTFTITPTANGCTGTPITATVTVNPIPDAVATPASQSICSGQAITSIVLSGAVSGTTYNWTRDNAASVTGIAASGSGNITGTLTNTTNAPVTVTFTITPSANGCTGTAITATVLVNPTPDANATPLTQTICSGQSITSIVLSSGVAGASLDWTRNNTGTVTGIAASGSGDISGALVNTTGSPVTVTFTITPTANGCPGTAITATVIVNPAPDVTITGGNNITCQGVTTTLSSPNVPGMTYNWEKSLSGLAGSYAAAGSGPTLGVTSSGIYRFVATDGNGCSATSDTNNVTVADYVFNGSLAAGDLQQTGRITRNGIVSTCAAPKTCPGVFTATGARYYDVYSITNPRAVPVCATIGIASGCGTNMFSVAYLGSFDPLNTCNNFLADPGSSFPNVAYYEATIPAGGTIQVVVHEVTTGTGCANYTLTVDLPREPSAATPVPASINCGGSSTITASVANSYLWSPGGQTTQSITVSPLTTTNYSVTLGYGNNGCTATANTTVTVVSTPPTISCPGNITLSNTTGQCGRVVTYTTTPGGTPSPVVTYTFTGATTASGSGDGSGSFFNIGTTTVTVTATNACGSATCSFTVTINDTEAPVIICPAPVTVSCAAAVPAVNIAAVIATDNCPGVVVSHVSDVISNQTCANRYTLTRTYRATDAVGNFAECTQVITVNDVTAPTITCPAPVTVSCAAAVPAVNIASVIATDNCAGTVVVTWNGDVISNQTCLNRYTVTRTYRATDACGNFAECTQIITVNDVTAPTITCPAPVTVSCASAVPAVNIASVIATDNCAGTVVVTWTGDVISNQTCLNRYTVTRTYRATDACGNFAECTQIITVNDQTAPVVTCPAPVTVSCASAVPAPNTALVTATDNCAGPVTITFISDVISGQTCANRYLITRTYRATDACGNFAECTQSITVNDVTPPVMTCPAPVTVSCASAVPAPNTALVTATDNCAGAVTITFVSDVISGQTCPNRYTITRTYRATDVCGNSSTCTQTITVNDQTAPVLTCPANINVLTPIGSCTAIVNFTPTATDNCNGAVTIVSVPASGSVFPIGTTTVNVTATDACGNGSTCSFTVTVVDAQLPVITQQPVTKFVCDGSNAVFNVISTNAVSYQWQQWNGSAWVNIAGATTATLTINAANFTQNTNTYRVAVIGLCTTVQSAAATLYVNPLPTVTVNTSIPPFLTPGQSLNLLSTVNPAGGSYRWFLNGTLVGSTGPNYNGVTIDAQGSYRLTYTDPNGCTNSSAEIVVVGQETNGLWVYPNPNQGSFNVRFYNRTGEKVTVNVMDSKGSRVYSREFVTSTSYSNMIVDLAALGMADGTYIVNVVGQEGKIIGSRKILVYRR